jgi:hypothetical protein
MYCTAHNQFQELSFPTVKQFWYWEWWRGETEAGGGVPERGKCVQGLFCNFKMNTTNLPGPSKSFPCIACERIYIKN